MGLAEALQPTLDLPPADHVRILHPDGRRGIATIAQGGARWRETAVPIAELAAFVADKAGGTDLFLSQQSFYGWRRIAQLAQLGAAYVDLDCHRTERWAGVSAEGVTSAVLEALDEVAAPAPSYVLSTGRGLLVLWLHGLVPRAALPRWMAVQKRLAQILAPFGADPRALDAARVFRLAGTENSKARAIVRPTFMAAPAAELWRWDFEDLAREVLPRERAEIIALRARRAERRARGEGSAPARTLTAGTYWETVLADLQRLRQARWFGPLPPGQRDTWLFLAGCAMSWLAPPFVMRRELHALAQEAGGWTEREAQSRMASLFRRAEQAAAGATVEWNGERVDPRYRFRASTIVEWLEITTVEMRDAGLRVLVDQDRARELTAERQTASRRRRGVQERATYEGAAAERAAVAKLLRSKGLPWAQVAERMGLPSPDAARKLADRTSPSRCMVAKPSPEGRLSLVGDLSPSGCGSSPALQAERDLSVCTVSPRGCGGVRGGGGETDKSGKTGGDSVRPVDSGLVRLMAVLKDRLAADLADPVRRAAIEQAEERVRMRVRRRTRKPHPFSKRLW